MATPSSNYPLDANSTDANSGLNALQFNRSGSLEFILRTNWWRRSFATAWQFAPNCIACATALTLGNLVILAGTELMEQRLHALQAAQTLMSMEPLFEVVALAVGVLVISLPLSLGALSIWLVKLTVFANAVLNSSAIPDADRFAAAAIAVKKRKVFFGKVWLVASLFLLVPMLPMAILLALKTVTGPNFVIAGEDLVPLPSGLTAGVLQSAIFLSGGLVSVIVLSYSFTTLVFSAVSTSPAARTAMRALSESWRNRVNLVAVAVMVIFVGFLVSAPFMLLRSVLNLSSGRLDFAINCAGQIWVGVMSVIVWPWSVTPFCELMRSSLEETDCA